MDILRFAQPGIIATLGGILTVIVVAFLANMMLKGSGFAAARGYVKKGTMIIIGLLVLAFAWQLIVAMSVNNVVNRSVIDRSGLNTQRYVPTATPFKINP